MLIRNLSGEAIKDQEWQGRQSILIDENKKLSIGASLGFGKRMLIGDSKVSASAHSEGAAKTEAHMEGPLLKMTCDYVGYDNNRPRWIIEPTGIDPKSHKNRVHLEGKPWPDPKSILKIQEKKDTVNPDMSQIRLIIRCERNDLDFFDFQWRKTTNEEFKKHRRIPKEKIIAAREYLKDQLLKSGLATQKMDTDRSIIELGWVISEPRFPGDK